MSIVKCVARTRHVGVGFLTLATVPAGQVWKLIGASVHNPLSGSTTVASLTLAISSGHAVDVETFDTLPYRSTATIAAKWTLGPGDQLGNNIASGTYCDVTVTAVVYPHV